MATILKEGKVPTRTATHACSRCNALVRYTDADLRSPQGQLNEESVVQCPTSGCNKQIVASALKWVTTPRDLLG